jgi:hypothetical protein
VTFFFHQDEYHPLWVISFHSLDESYARHRQRRFVENHVFIHQDEYHRVSVLFFPFALLGVVRDVFVSNVVFSFITMNIIHSGPSSFALSLRREGAGTHRQRR